MRALGRAGGYACAVIAHVDLEEDLWSVAVAVARLGGQHRDVLQLVCVVDEDGETARSELRGDAR